MGPYMFLCQQRSLYQADKQARACDVSVVMTSVFETYQKCNPPCPDAKATTHITMIYNKSFT